MDTSSPRPALIGFGLGAALFGAVDGFLIGETALSLIGGALIGGLIGVGLVLLAWKPRPQDGATARVLPGHQPNYMAIWGALFLLTALEVGVAFVALAKVAIVIALISLAVWKAVLVALYYMHLKFEPRRMWLLAASPLPLALILVFAVLYEGW